MSEVVHSVNIMIAILLIAVGIALYYIFMYDTWYPNDGAEHGDQDSSLGVPSGEITGQTEGAH